MLVAGLCLVAEGCSRSCNDCSPPVACGNPHGPARGSAPTAIGPAYRLPPRPRAVRMVQRRRDRRRPTRSPAHPSSPPDPGAHDARPPPDGQDPAGHLPARLEPSSSPAAASAGSGGGEAEPTASGSAPAPPTARPSPGDKLVVLKDDKGLQNSDNIIPAINKAAADKNPEIVDLLNSVSAALDTDKLIAAQQGGRHRPQDVAPRSPQAFVTTNRLEATDKSGSGKLVVGAANFSENVTLAEIYGEVLTVGRVRRRGPHHRQPRDLPAGAREGRPGRRPRVRGDAGRLPQRQDQRRGRQVGRVRRHRRHRRGPHAAGRAEQARHGRGRRPRRTRTRSRSPQEFADAHKVTTLSELAAACGAV